MAQAFKPNPSLKRLQTVRFEPHRKIYDVLAEHPTFFSTGGEEGVSLGKARRRELDDLDHASKDAFKDNIGEKVTYLYHPSGRDSGIRIIQYARYKKHGVSYPYSTRKIVTQIAGCLNDYVKKEPQFFETTSLDDLYLLSMQQVLKGTFEIALAVKVHDQTPPGAPTSTNSAASSSHVQVEQASTHFDLSRMDQFLANLGLDDLDWPPVPSFANGASSRSASSSGHVQVEQARTHFDLSRMDQSFVDLDWATLLEIPTNDFSG